MVNSTGAGRGVARRRVLAALGAAVVAVLALVVSLAYHFGFVGRNFREVVPGEVYRSAHLAPADLAQVIRDKHLRTVINLEGDSPRHSEFKEERALCDRMGARYAAVGLRATALPDADQMRRLLDLFDHAERPLLFHCRQGADRSGLAATLYLNLYCNLPLDAAEATALTWHTGHLSFGRTGAMDDFFNLYRRTASGLSLRDWIVTRYPALDGHTGRRRG